MDALPVNRLLKLLRQQSPDASTPPTPTQYQQTSKAGKKSDTQHVTSTAESDPPSATFVPKSDTQYVPSLTESDPPSATFVPKSDTQYVPSLTESDPPSATFVPKSDTQYATSSPFPLPKSDTQHVTSTAESDTPSATNRRKSSTPLATKSDTPSLPVDLAKGQRRVLGFLAEKRDPHRPSQTIPIGYDPIARACFLSRSGLRKVLRELSKKGFIRRIETKRGELQGSVYRLKSSTLYATKSDIPSATSEGPSCSSSSKDLLLQGLILEDAFQDLNPRSLLPYVNQFDTTEELQRFVDMANACIAAAKDGRGKPIQNPQGFLFAQLRAGYINPPEGYKSRQVRAQERRNQQLEAELAALRQLKAREQELQFEVFKAKLTTEDLARLEHEARAQVRPKLGLSAERQLEVHKDMILQQWFAQRSVPAQG